MKRKIAALLAVVVALSAMAFNVAAAPPAGATNVYRSNFAADLSGFQPHGSGLGNFDMANDIISTLGSEGTLHYMEISNPAVGGPRFAPLVFDPPISAPQVYMEFEVFFENAGGAPSITEFVIRDGTDLVDYFAGMAPAQFASAGDASRSRGTHAFLGHNIFRITQSYGEVFFGAGTAFQEPDSERVDRANSHIDVRDVQAPFMMYNSWIRVALLFDFDARTVDATLTDVATGASINEVLPMGENNNDAIGSISPTFGREGGGNAGGTVRVANIAIYTLAGGAPAETVTPPAETVTPPAETTVTPPVGGVQPPPAGNEVDKVAPPTGDTMTLTIALGLGGLVAVALIVRRKLVTNK